MEIPTLAQLLTVGGLGIAVSIVFELLKRVFSLTAPFVERYGALIAVALGIAIGGGAAAVQHVDIVPNIVNGIIAGLISAGVWDTVLTRFLSPSSATVVAPPG